MKKSEQSHSPSRRPNVKERVTIEPIKAGSKVSVSVDTQILGASVMGGFVRVSAWPIRVGAPGGLNWKTFKSARRGANTPQPLRAPTK